LCLCLLKRHVSAFVGVVLQLDSFSWFLFVSLELTMADDGHDETVAVAAPPPPAELPEIKLFGRWSCDEVQISDMSLQVMFTVLLVLQKVILIGEMLSTNGEVTSAIEKSVVI
jgi:hypothetical protein